MKFFLKSIILFICITFFTGYTYSQKETKEEKRILKRARKNLANENYIDAQNNYLKLTRLRPNSDIVNFETGLSYYFSNFEKNKSIKYFETALKNSKEDTIPELKYYLGRAYHMDGQYEKSKTLLNEFTSHIKKHTRPGQYLLKETNYRVKISDNAKNITLNEKIQVKNLGKGVNTIGKEYAPVYKEEEDVILFTSRREGNKGKKAIDLLPYEDVYVAKRNTPTSWSLIEGNDELNKFLPKGFNTKKHDAGIVYSTDGKTLYTYKEDFIWKSIFKENEWNKLEKLNSTINESQFNVPSINLTKDGNTLFFVTYKKSGFGGKDIYRVKKDDAGNWSEPENLGEKINTPFDEDAPFLSNDGKTLYFSSKGHNGIGGYDIFKSELIDDKFSEPINLGLPINSPMDDIYFILNKDGLNGFLSSNRVNGFGDMDIYSFCTDCPKNIINILKGILVDKNDVNINNASITIYSNQSDSLLDTYSLKNGNFEVITNTVGNHKLTIENPNYEKQSINISLPDSSSNSTIKIKMYQIESDTANYQIINLINNELSLNLSDTIKLEKTLVNKETPIADDTKVDTGIITKNPIVDESNTDADIITENAKTPITKDNTETTVNNNSPDTKKPNTRQTIATYQEFFDYNVKSININQPYYLELISKAVKKAQSGDKIVILIESSASRVPTKTYKSNIKLASLRGDEAKSTIIKTLVNKGVDKNIIIIDAINSIVSGPKYSKDYKNVKKYNKFQYVKITLK